MGKRTSKKDALDDNSKVKKSSEINDLIEESSDEVKSTNIPPFCKAKYLVVKKSHPKKGKDTRDGFVLSLILISYIINDKGEEEKLVVVEKEGEGKNAEIKVDFPKGTSGLMATMYSGPKSNIKFIREKKWYQVDKKKFDYKYFLEWFSKKNPAAKKMGDDELDEAYVEYLEKFYNFGLAQNFGLEGDDNIPTVGMATYFYRKYTPPEGSDKYGQINISKWPGTSLKDKFPTIDGKFSYVDESLAEMILEAYMATKTKKDDVSFNYGDNAPVEEDVI